MCIALLLCGTQALHALEPEMTINVPGPILELRRGLILGNGDLSASVTQTLDERITWRLGKSEMWDRRFAHEKDGNPITQRELLDGVRNKGWTISTGYEVKGDRDVEAAQKRNSRWDSYADPYPQPKPVADMTMSWPGAGGIIGWSQSVDLAGGIVTVRANAHRHPAGAAPQSAQEDSRRDVESFVLPDMNVMVTRWKGVGPGMKDLSITLHRKRDTYHAHSHLAARYDAASKAFVITQRLHPEPTFPAGFEAHVAGMCPGAEVREINGLDGARIELSLTNNETGQVILGVGTSYDRQDALANVRRAAELSAEEMDRRRNAYWSSFWARSNVTLARKDLQRFWRYNTYLMGCVLRPGIVSPALYFPSTVGDWNEWKGDYHFDLNVQMAYWSVYSANHADLAEPYDRLVHDLAPLARSKARDIFDCKGLAFPFIAYPIKSDHLPWYRIPWSRCMFLSAGVVQPLGWRWLYTEDDEYLKKVAFPMLAGACEFYLDFLTRDSDGVYHVFPTVSPEHWGITKNFDRNRDCTLDLAQIRWLFRTTIRACERLKGHDTLRTQLANVLPKLAEYPRTKGPHGEVWADVEGAPYFQTNIMVPIAPVFPGDEVGLGSPPEILELARRTRKGLSGPGWFGHVSAARLGMLDLLLACVANYEERCLRPVPKVEYPTFSHGAPRPWGKFMEDLGSVLTISEMLVQSHQDAIRLFPTWPREHDASFRGLRTLGAFLISAALEKGKVREIRVYSEQGQVCRIVNPWAPTIPLCNARGRDVAVAEIAGALQFDTRPGEEYALTVR